MLPERASAGGHLPAAGLRPRRLAILATSSYGACRRLPELLEAPSQMELLAARLAEPDAGFSVEVLAAERGMTEALEDLLQAPDEPIETLLFFFSGYVAVSEEEIPSLLLDGERLSTLSLRRVRRLVAQAARSTCVVLDTVTAFEPGGDPRGMVSSFHDVVMGDRAGIHLFASNRADGAGPSAFSSLFALCLDWHASGAELTPDALHRAMRAEEALYARISCAELFEAAAPFQILVPDASRARSIPPQAPPEEERASLLEPAPEIDAVEVHADALLAAGDVDGAIEEYAVLLERLGAVRTPAHAPVYAKVGAALRAAGQKDEARDYYEAALDIDPNLTSAIAGAAELRAEGGDARGARELYERWLAVDPNALAALERAAESLAESGAWDDLERLYSAVLARVTDPEPAVELAFHIDVLCRERLSDPARATAALERASELAPNDASVRLRLSALCEEGGDFPRALEHLRAAFRAEPGHVAGYRRAMRLFDKCGRPDGAWNAASALEALGEADVNESLLAEAHRPEGLLAAKDSLSEEHWMKRMLSPARDAALDAIFSALGDAVVEVGLETARRKRRFFTADPSAEQDPKTSTITLVKTLAWSARLLGIGLPRVYIVPDLRTSFAVPPSREPTICANKALASGLEMPELAFLWSRQLAFLRAEHRPFLFFPNVSELAALLLAALSTGGAPGVPLKKLEDDAKLFARGLRRHLERSDVERLGRTVLDFPLREASSRVRAWVRAAELTANRAGLLACGSVAVAAKLVRRFPLGGGVDADEQVKDLLAFSVSEPYAALRDRIGVLVQT